MHALTMIAVFLGFQDAAFDFGKIERKIKSEPKYEAGPRYAMLAVGADAKIRMWMAMDVTVGDDVVYIDRDLDGNLGEEGERFVTKKDPWGNVIATIGKIEFPDEKTTLEDFVVTTRFSNHKNHQPPVVHVRFRLNGKVTVSGGQGPSGSSEWGTSTEKAPILYANPFGPLSFLHTGSKEMTIGAESNVTLNVGTWGEGPSTFCIVDEKFLDLDKDKLIVTLIAKDSKGNEVRKRFQLRDHC